MNHSTNPLEVPEIDPYKENANTLNNFIKRMGINEPDTTEEGDESERPSSVPTAQDVKERIASFATSTRGQEILIGVGFGLVLLSVLRAFLVFGIGFKTLNTEILGFNMWTFGIQILLPIGLWAYSTNTEYWNYFDRKFLTLRLVGAAVSMQLITATFFLSYKLLIPFVAMVKVTPDMTEDLIVGLGYIACFVPTLTVTLYLWHLNKSIITDDTKKSIAQFKLKHHMEEVSDDPLEYTMQIVTDMQTGKKVIIPQHDRFTHTEATGATGTAKTSSCILPAIADDLDTKIRNSEAQKKAAYAMIDAGKAYMVKKVPDSQFNINLVKPNPGHEKEYQDKVLKYKSAGITVIGPDDSLSNEVAALAAARGVRARLVDPIPDGDTGLMKKGFTGYNPLYISPNIPEWSKRKAIVKSATLFADVMQAIFDNTGKSDPYFSSINRIATTTICILLNVTYPILNNGKQPNPKHVQMLMNDFSRIQKYYECLVDIDKNDEYMVIRDVIRNSFLGLGRTKFEEHCNGLKVQLNNFMMDPNVEAVLCAEETIDLDQALLDGDVVIVNFALGELGHVNSTAFGLFFTMSYVDAVLRRPGNEFTRLPNFCYIDELPVILSPALEPCFTLFRKFRVAMFVALQTFDQMEKNPYFKYLKGILLNSCSHHIIFGRANTTDMKIFSEMAGLKENVIEQRSYTQTSVTVENPQLTESVRYTPELINAVEMDEIRNRDFQEVTFFTVFRGRPLPPIHGKVAFLTDKQRRGTVKRKPWDWENLYLEQVVITRSIAPKKVAALAAATTAAPADSYPSVSPRVTSVLEEDHLAEIRVSAQAIPKVNDPSVQAEIRSGGVGLDAFDRVPAPQMRPISPPVQPAPVQSAPVSARAEAAVSEPTEPERLDPMATAFMELNASVEPVTEPEPLSTDDDDVPAFSLDFDNM